MPYRDADSLDEQFSGERTDLSWNRSGLAILVCGAVVLRGLARPPYIPAQTVAGVVILAIGMVVWFAGLWLQHRRAVLPRRVARASDLLPIALGTAIVGFAAFMVSLLSVG